jgi:stage II sporulation protein AA (anti-sigma F factor antagonist)
MSEVTFMDSSGIGLIIGRYKNAESSGGRLIISNMNEHIRRIFDISGLAKIVQTVDTMSTALDMLGVGGNIR